MISSSGLRGLYKITQPANYSGPAYEFAKNSDGLLTTSMKAASSDGRLLGMAGLTSIIPAKQLYSFSVTVPVFLFHVFPVQSCH